MDSSESPAMVVVNAETEVECGGSFEKERAWLEAAEEGMTAEEGLASEEGVEEEAPTAVVITNCPPVLFRPEGEPLKAELEALIRGLADGGGVWCEWFSSFRRVRAHFASHAAAASARLHLDRLPFQEQTLRAFYAQTVRKVEEGSQWLWPPALEKQFLISPPASPPVGWLQTQDGAPVINFELMQRLAALSTNRHPAAQVDAIQTELHPATVSTPSIVVHTAPSPLTPPQLPPAPPPPKMPRTPRPPNSTTASAP